MEKIEYLSAEMMHCDSLVCVGLDPLIDRLPQSVLSSDADLENKLFCFLSSVVELTADQCVAYKIQKAFFDPYPFGHSLLKSLTTYIKTTYPSKMVIIDCKIGDVEHTLKAYTQNLFDIIGADSIVVNPYMGMEILDIFDQYPHKFFVVLVRTSNPGAYLLQDLALKNGQKLWMHVLGLLARKSRSCPNIIPVLSFQSEGDFEYVRPLIPPGMPVFYAGYGAQGNLATNLNALVNTDGYGVLVNSSRGILYENYEVYPDWRTAVRSNVISMRNTLNHLKRA